MVRQILRRTAGQASLDYIAILGVATVVLAAGTGAAFARGSQVTSSVRTQFIRALCIVTGGDCDRDRAPCAKRSSQDAVEGHVGIVLRVGKSHVVLLDELSDGSYHVTLVSGWDKGIEGGFGVKGTLAAGAQTYSVGAEFRAALLGRDSRGSTWVVKNERAARRLVAKIRDSRFGSTPFVGRDLDLPAPDQTIHEHDWSLTIGSKGALGSIGKGGLTLAAKDLDGAREDHRTGHWLLYLARTNGLDAMLEATAHGETASGAAAAGRESRWAIEVDREGRPLDLMILSAGEYRGHYSLPDMLAQAGGYLGVPARGARRYEAEQHLDLRDPANLDAARAFIEQVREGRPRPYRERVPVSGRLAARLRDHAVIHARTYDVDATTEGASFSVADGLKVMVGGEHATRTTRLLAAVTRGPDGTWQMRTDCVGQVDNVRR